MYKKILAALVAITADALELEKSIASAVEVEVIPPVKVADSTMLDEPECDDDDDVPAGPTKVIAPSAAVLPPKPNWLPEISTYSINAPRLN